LAGRSAEAAKEIKSLINDSVIKVGEGARLVDQSGSVLQEIVGAVQKVNTVVAEIASASREQTSGIGEVNSAIAKIEEMTGKNAGLVDQDAEAAKVLLALTHDLSQAMDKYRFADVQVAEASRPGTRPGRSAARAHPTNRVPQKLRERASIQG
jgi:methyl-accepting chemotaxis protein